MRSSDWRTIFLVLMVAPSTVGANAGGKGASHNNSGNELLGSWLRSLSAVSLVIKSDAQTLSSMLDSHTQR